MIIHSVVCPVLCAVKNTDILLLHTFLFTTNFAAFRLITKIYVRLTARCFKISSV